MTTLTIEVTDEQAKLLAESLGEPERNFHDVARQVIQENAELYRRLA